MTNPINVRRFLKWAVALVVLYFAVILLNTVTAVEEQDDLSIEGSGTCYRVAAESRDDARVRAMMADRFLTRGECRELYQLVDQRAILKERFEQDKKDALMAFYR